MRSACAAALLAGGLFSCGCAPELVNTLDPAAASTTAAAEGGAESGDSAGGTDSAVASDSGDDSAATVSTHSDTLGGAGDYGLFELGPSQPGDRWNITPASLFAPAMVVGLFDSELNLLERGYFAGGGALQHVVRTSSEQLYLGVMTPLGGAGGAFTLSARRTPDVTIPEPARQIVYLHFEAASEVQVFDEPPISFGAFDGAVLGSSYADQTSELKSLITAAVRQDYAAYNIEVLSSDEGAAPTQPHSVLYFGGSVEGLLGLADSVDRYNSDSTENALIYLENFAPYSVMELATEEMAAMIANVASHELGHLLGLYHTQRVDDVMDTTGTAWDLAADQAFRRAELESSVFSIGYEDSPTLLSQTLGPSSEGASGRWTAPVDYAVGRRLADEALPHACGTCAALDR